MGERAQGIQLGYRAPRGGGPMRGPPSRHQPQMTQHRRGRVAGSLAEWNHQKGCGWIESKSIPNGRIFCHKSEFNQPFEDGNEPPVGTVVHFTLGTDPKSGKDRAMRIDITHDGAVPEELRLSGTLREWNNAKACGWIESSEYEGAKLFAHKSELAVPFPDTAPPDPGTPVTFVLGTDAKSGKERAVDIQIVAQ